MRARPISSQVALLLRAVREGSPWGGGMRWLLHSLGLQWLPYGTMPTAGVRKLVDAIAGEGCTQWLITTFLCWGHVRVIMQLPPPPATADEVGDAVKNTGPPTPEVEQWWNFINLGLRWADTSGKHDATDDRYKNTGLSRSLHQLGRRLIAMPPVGLAQVLHPPHAAHTAAVWAWGGHHPPNGRGTVSHTPPLPAVW